MQLDLLDDHLKFAELLNSREGFCVQNYWLLCFSNERSMLLIATVLLGMLNLAYLWTVRPKNASPNRLDDDYKHQRRWKSVENH